MKISRVDAPMRLFLAAVATLLWVGIWHTGFAVASWIIYLPAIFFVFAAITGICPGLIISRALFRSREA